MTEKEVLKTIQQIQDLKIQGNTNIAKTVAKTLLDYISNTKVHDFNEFIEKVQFYGFQLANARANEPLAVNAVTFIIKNLELLKDQHEVRIEVAERIKNYFKYIDESYEIIRLNAVNLLRGHNIFYTHCHSALARDILIRLNEVNNGITVINDETRPLLQGRITATKLSEAGVRVLHTLDSAVSSIFLDSRYPKPEVVVVGCDGITFRGDFINKVGTLNIALAAQKASIPLYVVTQTMKIDLRSQNNELQIEQRSKDEIWPERPENVDIINPSFDFIPAEYVTGGFITEKGLMKPEDFGEFGG
jgi:eIF-2B alpha/beta/delta-like uncharacterized protein